jgi:hypothetical protein
MRTTLTSVATVTVQLFIMLVVLIAFVTQSLTVVILMVIESADNQVPVEPVEPAQVEPVASVKTWEGMRWNELRAYAKSRGCPSNVKSKPSMHAYLQELG